MEAEFLYRKVLSGNPNHAEALHLLGLIASDADRNDAAAVLIAHAIRLQGNVPLFCSNLGLVLTRQGKLPQAIACFRQALAGKPDDPAILAHMGRCLSGMGRVEEAIIALGTSLSFHPEARTFQELGNVLIAAGRAADAIACFERAVELNPGLAESYFTLGNLRFAAGHWDRGADAYEGAIQADRGQPQYHFNLGVVRTLQERYPEAMQCYAHAVQLRPEYAEAHNNLGILHQKGGDLAQAAWHYERALEIEPGYPDAWYNTGSLLQEGGDHQEACAIYRNVLANPRLTASPAALEGHVRNNLANGLLALGEPQEALAEYDRALVLHPEGVEARWNRAVARLTLGRYGEAWEDYEWRLRQPDVPRREFAQPRWDGAPLAGRRLLLHAEQGLGDTLQFARYAGLIPRKNPKTDRSRVILECQPPLTGLLARLGGVDSVVGEGLPLPEFDVRIPLLSLPGIFGTALETIPGQRPYLSADPVRSERWRIHMESHAPSPALRVGLCWSGNPKHRNDANRSLPAELLTCLAGLPGIAYFNLQVEPKTLPTLDFTPLLNPLYDFEETAALTANLDLVITVDTAVAHLAGGMGRPVWVLLPLVADWRWLTGRDDSPWHPSAKLFRQTKAKDWRTVIERVKEKLQDLAA